MKKYIAFLLSTVIFLGICPSTSFAASKGTNLALNKPTYSSSYYSQGHIVKNINDGSYQTIWAQGEFPDGGRANGYEYVMVDLEDNYWIYSLDIVGRPFDNETYKDLIVEVSTDRSFTNPVTVTVGELPANNYRWTVVFENDNGFRYVRIRKKGHFSLSELEVYGEKFDPTRKFVRKFEDTLGTKFDGPARTVDTLGILTKSSNYEFGAYYVMSRADALKSVMKLIGQEVLYPDTQIFTDVSLEHPIAPYLYHAVRSGIIAQNDVFRPDDYVTVHEFLKMILYAFEYGPYVEMYGDYPTGVRAMADRFDLLKRVDLSFYDYVNKENAAMILYNALKIAKLSNEKAIVTEAYDMRFVEGILDGNAVTTLLTDKGYGLDSVTIDGVRYTDRSGFANELIGTRCIALVDSDDCIQNIWLDHSKCTVKKYIAEDLEIEGKRLKQVDKKTDEVKDSCYLADKPDVLKNGVVYPAWDMNYLEIDYGHMELIDNNGDKKIDVINIWQPVVAVLKSIEKLSNNNILLQSVDGNQYLFNEPEVEKIQKNGRITTYGRLESGSLMQVYVSDNGANLLVDVSEPNKITAKATGMAENEITVDGVAYRLSGYLNNHYQIDAGKLTKKNADYYLDEYGSILLIILEDTLEEGEKIGFIQRVSVEYDTEDSLIFRIFTQDNEFIRITAANRIKVDGIRKEVSEYTDHIDVARSYFEGKFVLFTINSEGKIKSLDTEHYDQSIERDSRMRANLRMISTDGVFCAPANGFFEGARMLLPCKRETLAFKIPSNGEGNYAREENNDTNYSVKDVEALFPTMTRMETNEYAKVYGQDDNRQPLFVALFSPYYEGTGGQKSAFLTDCKASAIVVNNVSQTVDDDNCVTYMIKGYQFDQKGAETTIMLNSDISRIYDTWKIQQEHSDWLNEHRLVKDVVSSEITNYEINVADLKKGDIIRYQSQGNTISIAERVFSIGIANTYGFTNDIFYSTGTSFPAYPSADFMLLFGKNPVLHDEYLTVKNNSNDHTFDYSNMKQIFVCEDNYVEQISVEQIAGYIKPSSKILFLIKNYQYVTMMIVN